MQEHIVLKLLLIGAVITTLLAFFSPAEAAVIEDFETYTPGSLPPTGNSFVEYPLNNDGTVLIGDAYSGVQRLLHEPYHSLLSGRFKATSTESVQNISWWVKHKGTTETVPASSPLSWDTVVMGNVTVGQDLIYAHFCKSDDELSMTFYLDADVVGGGLCTDSVTQGSYTFDTWHKITVEFDTSTDQVRARVNTDAWTPWESTDFNVEYLDGFNINGFASSTYDYFESDSDLTMGNVCSYEANWNYDVNWKSVSDFNDGQPYKSALVFSPDSNCSFNKVRLLLDANGGWEDWVSVRLHELATSTSDMTPGTVRNFSLYNEDPILDGSTYTDFEFVTTNYLDSTKWYGIEIQPFHIDEQDSGKLRVGTYDGGFSPNGVVLNKYLANGQRFNTAPTEPMLELFTDAPADASVKLDLPCHTDDLDYATGGCVIAYPNADAFEVDVVGTSTSFISWPLDAYQVATELYDQAGNLIYDTVIEVADPSIPQPINEVMYFFFQQSPQVLELNVCQQEPYTSFPKGEGNCARVYIGWGMDVASTTQTLEDLGLYNISGLEPPPTAQQVYTSECVFESWDDYLNVFKGVKCAMLWLFVPSDVSLAAFGDAKDKLLTSYPIGYATHIVNDVNDAYNSTSTEIFTKEIGIGKYFGKPGVGTTTLEFDVLFQHVTIINPIASVIDTILWIGFAIWFLTWAFTRRL